MTRENVYLLLLLLPLYVLKQTVGSCENRTNLQMHYDVCRYQMIYNPHQYNLNGSVETIISSSLISKIQRDSFTGTDTIISLSIENSQISEIANGAWDGFVALKILKLPHNNLTSVKDNTFSSLVLLEELKIPNNKLETLETDAFAELFKLKILDLSFNNISKINHAFNSLQSLNELDISHNSLASLKSFSFQKMDSLVKINLSKNEIFMIEKSAFIDLHQLKQIDLSNNKITKIDSGVFNNLKSVAIVHLNNNKIRELRALEDLQSLITLNMANNSLPKIEKTDFQKHSKLIELDFRENRIQSVDIDSFGDLSILKRLDLSKNLLTSINTGIFSGLHALEYLNISRNQIKAISGFPLHTPVLQNLDLSRNELNYFDPSDLPQNCTLDIQGNPVSCSALTDLLKKLRTANVTLVRGNSPGENSIHGIPCGAEERTPKPQNGENSLDAYLERDFQTSTFVNHPEARWQSDSANTTQISVTLPSNSSLTNKDITDEPTQISLTLPSNSSPTSTSNKLDELIKNKSISQKIPEPNLEQLIDLLNGENISKLVIITKNVSIPEKEKTGDSSDWSLIQAIKEIRYDLYTLTVTNFTIIIMLGTFMATFIYFKYRTYRRRRFRENAAMTYSNELIHISEC